MPHPLVEKIIAEGAGSVNVTMLTPGIRRKLMTEAGIALIHQGRYQEAADALFIAGNAEELQLQGNWFLQQNNYAIAAYFLLHGNNNEQLEALAQDCIAAHEIAAAKAIYEKLSDERMLEFLKENFSQEL